MYSLASRRMAITSLSDKCDRPLPPVEKQSLELSPRLPKYRCAGLMQLRCLMHSLECSTHKPVGIGPTNSWYDMTCARCSLPATFSMPYPFQVSALFHNQCPSTLSMLDNSLSNSSMVLLYYGV